MGMAKTNGLTHKTFGRCFIGKLKVFFCLPKRDTMYHK